MHFDFIPYLYYYLHWKFLIRRNCEHKKPVEHRNSCSGIFSKNVFCYCNYHLFLKVKFNICFCGTNLSLDSTVLHISFILTNIFICFLTGIFLHFCFTINFQENISMTNFSFCIFIYLFNGKYFSRTIKTLNNLILKTYPLIITYLSYILFVAF